jgi:HSP20 family protein
MFRTTRWNHFDDIFNFQREADRLFNQLWTESPVRSSRYTPNSQVQVRTSPDDWRVEIPMPGVDPKHVSINVAGNTIMVRAEQSGGRDDDETRFEQTMTVPAFLDLDRVTASHVHGMLELTLPLKDSVKPRRIQIEGVADAQKQLTTA